VYLLDQAVGLESYERVSKSVAVDLVVSKNLQKVDAII
jgi:hypothetical protein